MTKRIIITLLYICLTQSFSFGAFVETYNTDYDPPELSFNCYEIGWVYTPQQSYSLTGIYTRLGYGGIDYSEEIGDYTESNIGYRDVTVEVFDAPPSKGGRLLRSVDYRVEDHSLQGVTFEALDLHAGEDYFIGFRNIDLLLVNLALDDEALNFPCYATRLPYDYSDQGTIGTYNTRYNNHDSGLVNKPILAFEGVPEPATLLLFGLGGLLLRKRRS